MNQLKVNIKEDYEKGNFTNIAEVADAYFQESVKVEDLPFSFEELTLICLSYFEFKKYRKAIIIGKYLTRKIGKGSLFEKDDKSIYLLLLALSVSNRHLNKTLKEYYYLLKLYQLKYFDEMVDLRFHELERQLSRKLINIITLLLMLIVGTVIFLDHPIRHTIWFIMFIFIAFLQVILDSTGSTVIEIYKSIIRRVVLILIKFKL